MTSFYGEYRARDIISDEEENRVSRANVDKWIFRLLLILIGFMPLIVLAHTEEVISPLISDVSVLTSGTKGDLFTYYKSLIVLVITIIAGLLLFSKIFFMNGKFRKTILNYFLGAFVFAIVMSTILSPNITIALNGQYNRSDGAISWLCYIALMFIAMNINYPKKAINYVIYSLIPFVYINLFIITMNFIGNDLMQKTWMQKIVTIFLPDGANLAAGSQLVGTLNQWNYMSGMFAIMTVMFLTWSIVEKSWIQSIIGLITAIASMTVMFISISTSGFLTILVIVPFLIWIILKMENRIKGIIVFLIFIIVNIPIFNTLAEKDVRVWNESFGFYTNINPYLEDRVSIKEAWDKYELINKVHASDNTFELPVLAERGFSSGSGRSYIWDKTIDLLENRPLFGYGLDSLMYNFPHYNIDARAGMWDENTITDKPHNTYIGVLYGTGIIGFIAILAILVILSIIIIKSLFKKINIQYFILGYASLAYFIQAMFNDSLPGLSAVLWIIIGMMFSLIFTEKEIEESNQ
ncbi:O-antigen ligase family protein [Lysinibacillus telephonicus]|uniref:O-antigen ligase family protein n=1 Tax=Lysinibacillus telephonicus TaxID=1714840 RepID=UPI00397DDC14